MAVVRQIALDQGYLAAKIEIDGKSNNFSAPQRLLYNIWLSLEGKGLSLRHPCWIFILKPCKMAMIPYPNPSRT